MATERPAPDGSLWHRLPVLPLQQVRQFRGFTCRAPAGSVTRKDDPQRRISAFPQDQITQTDNPGGTEVKDRSAPRKIILAAASVSAEEQMGELSRRHRP